MPPKRIALVAYPPHYFWPFAQALEAQGFEVYWVCLLRSHAAELHDTWRVPASRVLDVNRDFSPDDVDLATCRAALAQLERPGAPRIHDLILMDRILRRRPFTDALAYLHHVHATVDKFLRDNRIALVTSGRDTAPQMVIMLTARRLGVGWVVPTRPRIPREMYGFCDGHETADMLRFRDVTHADRAWAEEVYEAFCDKRLAPPALKTATRSFADVVRLLPVHVRLFADQIRRARTDDNHYTRYTIRELIELYVRRRVNLLRYKLFPPYTSPGQVPFGIYALHTQPESSIDVAGSFFSDQIALVTFIARSLPVTHELYVKVHPTDVDGQPLSFYRRLAAVPGVRLINFDVDSRQLVSRASVVFALTGTMGYEAALMGKPVISFARNYFNTLPTVYYCDAPPQLPALVSSLLTAPAAIEDVRDGIIDFLADVRTRCFVGEVNRMYGEAPSALTADDLRMLQIAYDAVFELTKRRREGVADSTNAVENADAAC